MAYGDIGGAVTELMVTCKAYGDIEKGDAVALNGEDYGVVRNGPQLFGEAMGDAQAGVSVTVKVRGISRFRPEPGTCFRCGERYLLGVKDGVVCCMALEGRGKPHTILKVKDGLLDVLM